MKRFTMLAGVSSLVVVLCATGVFASGQEEATGVEASGTIVLYTSVPQAVARRIQADFQARYPAVALNLVRDDCEDLLDRLANEREAGGIAADLVWAAEPSTYEDFKDQDLLLQFMPAESAYLPVVMKDPEGFYYAANLVHMVIGYNTDIEGSPVRWKDLLGPAIKGKIGFPSPLGSLDGEATVRTLADYFGWEFFTSFAANGGVPLADSSMVLDELSTGGMQVGVVLDYLARDAKAEGSPIDYVWPQDGAIAIPCPVAVLKHTENPEAAILFVDYLLSREGQATLVETGRFVPVRADVDPPVGAPWLSEAHSLPTNWRRVQRKRLETKNRWTSIFGY